MNSIKEVTIETIKKLPDECTIEDIMYKINFVAQVLESLKNAEEGKVISTEEILKRVEQWVK